MRKTAVIGIAFVCALVPARTAAAQSASAAPAASAGTSTFGFSEPGVLELGPGRPQLIGSVNETGLVTGFVRSSSPTRRAVPGGQPSSRIIYLNNCKGETTSAGTPGCRIRQGNQEDSATNTSTFADGDLAAYSGSDATWDRIVACVRDTYAPFDITIVDEPPAPGVPHWEGMAAGSPGNLGFPNGVGGVAPFSCGVIDNAVSFSFLNIAPNNVDQACWIIAQETAHAFGLSHEMLGTDPMTYIPNPPSKRFQDETACIGTQGCCRPQQECQCGVREQNSYQSILAIFGPRVPTPPVITIDSPGNNGQVSPGFEVRATVTDEQGVDLVELLIDGTKVGEAGAPPYTFDSPADLAQGGHMVTVRATDAQGTAGTAQVMVTVGAPCEDDDDCEVQGDDLVCLGGRCVPGEGAPGGVGTPCTEANECVTGVCAEKDGDTLCTDGCDRTANDCPDGYACLDNGAGGGLCWPGADGGCLGCATEGGGADPTAPIAAGLLLAALMVRRRRRPAA